MKVHKQSLRSILSILLFLSILFPSITIAKTWKSGHPSSPNTIADKTNEMFIDLVQKNSGGKIKINGFPAQQLGPWKDMFDNVVRGVQEIGLLPISPEFDPKLQALNTAYLASGWNEGKEIYNAEGWMFELMEPVFNKLGLKVLGFHFTGMAGLGSTKGPIVLPEDMENLGVKVRTWCQADRLFFQKAGAQTVDIAFPELFTSLQTGVVHAQDNAPEVTYTALRDVTKYYTRINWLFEPLALIINKELYDSLSLEDKDMIQNAASIALAWGNAESEKMEETYIQKMKDDGIHVTELTSEQLAVWAEVGRSTWPAFEKEIGKETMDAILSNIND